MGSHSKWPSLLSTDLLCSFLSRFQATVIGEEKEWKCAKSPSMVVSPGCEKPALPPFPLQADEPRALPRWEEVSGSLRAPRTQGDTVQPSPLSQPALTSHRPRGRSWGAGAGVTGGSVTFLQTGSPARHSRQAILGSHIPCPHISLGKEGESPLTSAGHFPVNTQQRGGVLQAPRGTGAAWTGHAMCPLRAHAPSAGRSVVLIWGAHLLSLCVDRCVYVCAHVVLFFVFLEEPV